MFIGSYLPSEELDVAGTISTLSRGARLFGGADGAELPELLYQSD